MNLGALALFLKNQKITSFQQPKSWLDQDSCYCTWIKVIRNRIVCYNSDYALYAYTKDTPNRLLSNYLRDYLHKLRARLEHLDHLMASESTPAREVTKARKESESFKMTLRECEDWEREVLLPLAQQRIELDLDDGVKVNYLKLGAALATIPGLASKEED